ncbi:MAG: OmpA family protein [Candidatus Anaerobiospirillum pullicola]|uniref:OmpA family protein n=1 Tax=Candidatus Anaerobiospirillum pullicola TaxID=2838451 RepID=A0A948THX5_9GAMM|nr:OmpA family protein [Candidatus Anaerobiospirillum pullicola]
MAKRKKAEGHVNLERWLVSYGDFLTLMFAVFVVLYSFAMAKSVDAQSMIKGLMASFNEMGMISSVPGVIALPGPVANFMADASLASAATSTNRVQNDAQGGGGVMDFGITIQQPGDTGDQTESTTDNDAETSSQGNLNATEVDNPTSGAMSQVTPDTEVAQSSGMTVGGELDQDKTGGVGPSSSEYEGDNPNGQPFDSLMRSISETITAQGLNSDIIVEHDPNWITINISSSLLFASNSASILTRSRPVIATIATALRDVNNYIRVRGYTDNSFVPSAIYGNNWELSSRRAINVLQELEANGIAPERLAAEAYGQYSPFFSNATRAGRAQNRRVVIAISREALKPENLAILPGNSEQIMPTRNAGQGGFSFETSTDGSLRFEADPVTDDGSGMAPPPAMNNGGAAPADNTSFNMRNFGAGTVGGPAA